MIAFLIFICSVIMAFGGTLIAHFIEEASWLLPWCIVAYFLAVVLAVWAIVELIRSIIRRKRRRRKQDDDIVIFDFSVKHKAGKKDKSEPKISIGKK